MSMKKEELHSSRLKEESDSKLKNIEKSEGNEKNIRERILL